jgi:3-isopropylmalate/(R)-2-methylmalate dehydratase small subunit
MISKGIAHKYGDNIDTDVIIPARHLNTSDPEELKLHCMEDIDSGFVKMVRQGDVIVGGKNFGCGSSREHAPIAIKASGISCVVAESFARIFYRNAINIGLPIIESVPAAKAIKAGETVEINFITGEITVGGAGGTCGASNSGSADRQIFNVPAFPVFIQEIITAGGLMNRVVNRIAIKK